MRWVCLHFSPRHLKMVEDLYKSEFGVRLDEGRGEWGDYEWGEVSDEDDYIFFGRERTCVVKKPLRLA